MILTFIWHTLCVYHKQSNLSANEGQGAELRNIWDTHLWLTELIWSVVDAAWVHVYILYSEYLQSNTFSEVRSHITHLCVVWINIKLTMSGNPLHNPSVSSLSFSGLSFPTCKNTFCHCISVPWIRVHRKTHLSLSHFWCINVSSQMLL